MHGFIWNIKYAKMSNSKKNIGYIIDGHRVLHRVDDGVLVTIFNGGKNNIK